MGLEGSLGILGQRTDLAEEMKQFGQVANRDLIERAPELNDNDKIVAVIGGSCFRGGRGFGQELGDLWGMAVLPAADDSDAEGFALAVSEIRVGIEAADFPFLF